MKRLMSTLLGSLGLLVWAAAGQVHAQFGTYPGTYVNPYTAPPISPFLNLARGGNPAINYFGIVRPQQDFRRSLQQLQYQNQTAPVNPYGVDESTLVTGHPSLFVNYSHYYYNNLSAGGLSSTVPGRTTTLPQYTTNPAIPFTAPQFTVGTFTP